jgi:hypothetical protein
MTPWLKSASGLPPAARHFGPLNSITFALAAAASSFFAHGVM